MRIEDREDYVDLVAQAVIDRIEERDRLAGLVDLVVRRVLELQQQAQSQTDNKEDTDNAEQHTTFGIDGNAGCHGDDSGEVRA